MPYIALFKIDGTAEERGRQRETLPSEARVALFGNPAAPSRATFLVGIEEPRALNLYREGTDFSPPFDLAIKAEYADPGKMLANIGASGLLQRFATSAVFRTEETTKKKPDSEPENGEMPGIHMLHPLRFHSDLPLSAVLRSWHVHGDLAVSAHAGAIYYSQQLVTDVPVKGIDGIGGFSEFHFPSMGALIGGYFAHDEARKAVRHDIRHFIDGIPPRFFCNSYVWSS